MSTKLQVTHDLAMACVSGVIQKRVKDSHGYESELDIPDLVYDALTAYKEAFDLIDSQIHITEITETGEK